MSIENHNISDIDKLGDGDTKLLTEVQKFGYWTSTESIKTKS